MGREVGSRELVECSPGCRTAGAQIVGGDPWYSPVSSICAAAIHAGVLTDEGGQVEVEVGPEQQSFKGSERNGVTSEDAPAYLRSFKFVHSSKASCTTTVWRPEHLAEDFSQKAAAASKFRLSSAPFTGERVVAIKDRVCDDDLHPQQLLLRALHCDKLHVDLKFFLTAASSFGVILGFQDVSNYYELHAIVGAGGDGKWDLRRVKDGQSASTGAEVLFRFPFNTWIELSATVDGGKFEGRVTEGSRTTVVADFTDTSNGSKMGTAGLSACSAPSSGLFFKDVHIVSGQ
eukprot:GHVU01205654.1.p1 GENE.GHVU01205654.1~~GHVU01205654.1.p1  ORF type:complete len:289 (+),score=44.46 GHVU01205654.1:492-1358(+)